MFRKSHFIYCLFINYDTFGEPDYVSVTFPTLTIKMPSRVCFKDNICIKLLHDMEEFQLEAINDSDGGIAIVTGANTGLGLQTAQALASKKYEVILACRNEKKADEARKTILINHPKSKPKVIPLDLSNLDSVKSFTDQFLDNYNRLDLLINNAGLMVPPYFKTKDGFEGQMGVNYLGHFLLTGLLLETLNKTDHSRIVTLSSIAHRNANINFDDINWENKYSKFKAYGQSKLACLMFAQLLDKKLKAANHNTLSLAAHPGISNTELSRYIPKFFYYLTWPIFSLITQKPEKGALPTLKAALDPDVKGAEYFGPTGSREMKGPPGDAEIKTHALDEKNQEKLWKVSEELVNFKFEL